MRCVASASAFANYPTTIGPPALREAIAGWLARRHGLASLDPATQVLPVLGSREALFAFGQTVLDGSGPARRSWFRIRSTRSTKAPRCWRARESIASTPIPRAGSRTTSRACRTDVWARTQLALRVLARQPDGTRARPAEVARALRAVRPLRLRRSPPTSAIRRSISTKRGRRSARSPPRTARRPRRLPAARRVRQPVQALERAGPALGLRRGRRRAASRRSCCIAPITAARCRARSRPRASRRGTTKRTCAPIAPSTRRSSRGCSRRSRRCCRARCPTPRSTSGRETPIDDVEFARRLLAEENVAVLPGQLRRARRNGINPGQRPYPARARRHRRPNAPRPSSASSRSRGASTEARAPA